MEVVIIIAVIGFIVWGVYANSQKQSNLPPQSPPIDTINVNIEDPINIGTIITEPPITIDIEESDNIEASLKKLIEDDIKDQVSGESFKPEERIYFCNSHKLAFHEDSWEYIGERCNVCGHSHHVSSHILPNLSIIDPDIIWTEITDNTNNNVRDNSNANNNFINNQDLDIDDITWDDITWTELTDNNR